MAYLWSDKITDYYWSNPELDTVAIAWTDPDDGLTREHYIMVDETDQQWNDFVKEVPYEKINERTENRHEQFREQFREAFRDWMTRDENNMTVQYKTVYEDRETVVEKEVETVREVEKEKIVYRRYKEQMQQLKNEESQSPTDTEWTDIQSILKDTWKGKNG